MQIRYIPAVITLLAGAVVSILSIIRDYDILYSLQLLLAVLIVFYIIGLIARKVIKNAMEVEKTEDEENEEAVDSSLEETDQETVNREVDTGDDQELI